MGNINPEVVMDAFCYNFCSRLLDGLTGLRQDGELFREDGRKLTMTALGLCNLLYNQITGEVPLFSYDSIVTVDQVNEIIKAAEDILTMVRPK